MMASGAAVLGLGILLVLLVLRVPLGPAMLLVGMGGYIALAGPEPLLNYMKTGAYWRFASYDFSVIPMFLLMGQLAVRSGMSTRLFDAANVFLGHRRGGVAMAAVGGCAAFGAICGSSLATAGTMSRVAYPELQRYRYSGALATGSLAAGGTLGILIPPSVVLIIYAVAVQANIVTMFEAALIPGLIALAGYLLTIAIYVRISPSAGPVGRRFDWSERLQALLETWPMIALFLLVIGGIYIGWFNPTEAAAIGAFGAALLAWLRGGLDREGLIESVLEVAQATAMIFIILLGADFLNIFLALAGFPAWVAEQAANSSLSPYLILTCMILFYFVLGCFMDSLAMIFLTVPVFWPIIAGLDFGLPPGDLQIWFGIIVLVVVELGLITPPVGLNVLIINAAAPGVTLRETFIGTLPFLCSEILRVVLLVLFPPIILFLPHLLN
ncbi:MAG: TRAP transporter large permease [Gammaproteobacteria bacterium]|nr:TRAP transporter large permease [Gammaproteobacteria bacterium]